MKEVQVIIDKINAKSDAPPILWSSAIPGAAINYTSIEDTRRRRGKDSFKTGKKRSTEVGQYVKYQNMSTLWVCVMPTNSQDPTKYEEGIEFPACELWNGDWTDEEAVKKGYTKPFANDYSNRIEGTDATMFGRPIRNDLAQVFISDIYRSAYLRRADIVDWYGVKAHRFEIQLKDMDNSTTNPENAAYFQHAPAGLENMTQATGAPIFASFPHFLYGQRDLVADIKGIDPREEIHTCYLDVEPQTGLLVGAKKRLQLAYLIESKTYPEAPKALDTEAAVCANLTNIVSTLHSLGLAENITIDCNLEVLTELLTCWQQPSTWTINSFREEGLYMPYGWVEEKLTLPESDATDLNDSLFAVDDLASDCRKLSLMIAGLCFASMLAMLLNRFYTKKYVEERIVELSRSKLLDNKYHSGDRNIRVDTNSEWSEPLMSPPNPLWEKKHASEDAADHKDDASYHFSG